MTISTGSNLFFGMSTLNATKDSLPRLWADCRVGVNVVKRDDCSSNMMQLSWHLNLARDAIDPVSFRQNGVFLIASVDSTCAFEKNFTGKVSLMTTQSQGVVLLGNN